MRCFKTVTIYNPKYKDDPMNQPLKIGVPCGKCPACLTNRRNDWSLRLAIELDYSTGADFITLTFNDQYLRYNTKAVPSVDIEDIQYYMKRIRHYTPGIKLRYYAVGEYGTKTKRPHYHILLFNFPNDKKDILVNSWSTSGVIKNSLGNVQIGTVTPASIHYVTKYHVNKTDFPFLANPSFVTMSRRPGIGNVYVEKFKEYHTGNIDRSVFTDLGGFKRRLPRYLRDKLYNDQERLLMAEKYLNDYDKAHWEDVYKHIKNNPDKNYSYYQVEKMNEFERMFKEKINKNDTF